MPGSDAKQRLHRSAGGRSLRVGLARPLDGGDPRHGLDYVNVFIWRRVYEPPFLPGEGRRVLPRLLEPPETREKALIASVAPGRFFSDGTPVSAELIAAGLNACVPFKQIGHADTEGNRVVLRPRRPGPDFAQQLTCMHYIVAKTGAGGHVLGTGPYRFADDSTPSRPHLVRNEHAADASGPDEIMGVLCGIGDGAGESPLLVAFRRGEIDYCDALSGTDAQSLTEAQCIWGTPDATSFLFFNVTAPGLWVRDARAALAKAIDVRAYASAVFGTERAVATGLLAPLFGIRVRGRHRFDLGRATAELAALRSRAALRTPLRMLMPASSRPHTPDVRAASEAMVRMLDAIGVAVEPILPTSSAEFARVAEAGSYDLAVSGWIAESLVATDVLEALLASTSIPSPARSVATCSNLARFGNIELDAALAKASQSGSVWDIAAVQDLVDQHVPLVPLVWGARAVVVRRGVQLPSGV